MLNLIAIIKQVFWKVTFEGHVLNLSKPNGVPAVKGSKLLKELQEVVVRKNIGLFKCKKFS